MDDRLMTTVTDLLDSGVMVLLWSVLKSLKLSAT